MTQISITILRVPPFSTLCNAAFGLRREVFVHEQKVPEAEELDAYDLTATHFVAVADGEVVGTLRLVDAGAYTKIGRVAVRQIFRGQGVAKALMVHAMEHARSGGQTKFELAAQADKLGFYEKLGFVAYGEMFDDAGIPHKAMRNF
jgi:predicted GNAT family N-acyltransferase